MRGQGAMTRTTFIDFLEVDRLRTIPENTKLRLKIEDGKQIGLFLVRVDGDIKGPDVFNKHLTFFRDSENAFVESLLSKYPEVKREEVEPELHKSYIEILYPSPKMKFRVNREEIILESIDPNILISCSQVNNMISIIVMVRGDSDEGFDKVITLSFLNDFCERKNICICCILK